MEKGKEYAIIPRDHFDIVVADILELHESLSEDTYHGPGHIIGKESWCGLCRIYKVFCNAVDIVEMKGEADEKKGKT